MSSRNLSLSQHLAAGQLPMFMTGNEIKQHYGIIENEKEVGPEGYEDEEKGYGLKSNYKDFEESDKSFWNRKEQESNAKVRSDMIDKHKLPDMDSGLSLKEHFKKHGVINPVVLQNADDAKPNKPVVLQGYHRVASNPDTLMPVEHKDYYEEYGYGRY